MAILLSKLTKSRCQKHKSVLFIDCQFLDFAIRFLIPYFRILGNLLLLSVCSYSFCSLLLNDCVSVRRVLFIASYNIVLIFIWWYIVDIWIFAIYEFLWFIIFSFSDMIFHILNLVRWYNPFLGYCLDGATDIRLFCVRLETIPR